MNIFLSIFVYVLQISSIVLVAGIIPFLFFRRRKKSFILSFVLCLSLTFTAIGYVSQYPIWSCPSEYSSLITAEEKEKIILFNSGIYSKNIPVFPISITVLYADDDFVRVRTNYILFGVTEMEVINGEPSLTKLII